MDNFLRYLAIALLITAMYVLATAEFGLLTIPGIVMALTGICFSVKEKHIILAIMAIITSTGSLIAQHYTTFCVTCTIAASLFALVGIIGLLQDKGKHLKINIILICLLGVGLFFSSPMFSFYQNPTIQDTGMVLAQSIESEEKAKLYISPTCSYCNEYLDILIEKDKLGEKCVVVTVPVRTLAQTKKSLEERGYKGEILSTASSPTGFVPALVVEDKILRGSEITNFFKEESNWQKKRNR